MLGGRLIKRDPPEILVGFFVNGVLESIGLHMFGIRNTAIFQYSLMSTSVGIFSEL